ncbi:hypothetical protein [Hymenobacter volaticus]|uniref:STAS/SEC14 domain-containing protein n=1 Tax=Hymenobacter volaticus TaxID=2932254 RepID=A0ABY4G2X8_9BACT|nr:hypothetical protein [Hymenobacter volaticus]UOQ65126.1 hypothetical protein MUN86_16390 [Hymenobacter volaticus]
MYLDYTASDFLTISYNCDTQILVGRWLRPVTPDESRRGYEELLTAARKEKASHWLLDVRRCQSSAPETLQWLKESYYPKATAELELPVCVVYFMSPDLLKDFKADGTLVEPASYSGNTFRLNLCTTESECIEWLSQQQVVSHQLTTK